MTAMWIDFLTWEISIVKEAIQANNRVELTEERNHKLLNYKHTGNSYLYLFLSCSFRLEKDKKSIWRQVYAKIRTFHGELLPIASSFFYLNIYIKR